MTATLAEKKAEDKRSVEMERLVRMETKMDMLLSYANVINKE